MTLLEKMKMASCVCWKIRHSNGCQSVMMWWGRRPCHWSFVWKVYLKAKNWHSRLAFSLTMPTHLQHHGLDSLCIQVEYLSNSTTSLLQLLYQGSITEFKSYYSSCNLSSILDVGVNKFVSAGECIKSRNTVNIKQLKNEL
jgi:hypothetical protein